MRIFSAVFGKIKEGKIFRLLAVWHGTAAILGCNIILFQL